MAKKYHPALDGWDNPKSYIYREEDGETLRFKGEYWVGSIHVRSSLNSQLGKRTGHYPFRGTMSVIASDGYVLQKEGDARRKIEKRLKKWEPDYVPGTRREELNVSKALHFQHDDEEEIKAYIARSAVDLCQKNLDAISKDLVQNVKPEDILLLDAWFILQSKFRKKYADRSQAYQDEVCASVERVCAACSRQPMRLLTAAMIHKYTTDQKNEKRVRKDIERAAEFWDLCRQQRLCTGDNPFRAWLGRYRRDGQANSDAALASASAQTALTQEQEKALYAVIREEWRDGQVRALLLALENGLPAKEISQLRVGDLVFRDTPPFVLIRRQKEQLHSATHNYTVPAAPLCGDILRSWYEELRQANPGKALDNFFVCGEGTKALPIKKVQDFCRWSLTKAGVTGGSAGKRRPTFELLRNNFRHRLLTYCGLRDEPGAVNFLLGNSLAGDTTSDHYRSFTDPEGQEMLYHALARDRRFFAGPKPEKPETDPEREVWTIPDHPGERGELSADLHVKAGTVITLHCPNGVAVSWSAKAAPEHAAPNGGA